VVRELAFSSVCLPPSLAPVKGFQLHQRPPPPPPSCRFSLCKRALCPSRGEGGRGKTGAREIPGGAFSDVWVGVTACRAAEIDELNAVLTEDDDQVDESFEVSIRSAGSTMHN